ncbi:MAG: transaldolase family protein [Anaerolineae bacterium]
MEFWIEGTIEQVIDAANQGLADAIATNPAIMERWTSDGQTLEQVVAHVCGQTLVPVYVQLRGPTMDGYLREMDSLRRISDHIHPKLVATHEGMAAARRIAADGLKPLITTISTLNQAYLAARANAAYVAPYIGRIGDSGADPFELVAAIANLYQRHGVPTQIAAASIRSPQQAEAVLRAGAPVLVMQYEVCQQLTEAPLTRAWIEGFDKNWTRIPHALGVE